MLLDAIDKLRERVATETLLEIGLEHAQGARELPAKNDQERIEYEWDGTTESRIYVKTQKPA